MENSKLKNLSFKFLLIIIAAFISVQSYSQSSYRADNLIANQSVKLNGKKTTGISNDSTSAHKDSTKLITEAAAKKYADGIIPYSAKALGVLHDGTDQTTHLQTAINLSGIKTIWFNDTSACKYVINGTVTVPAGKILHFENGNELTGAGTINGGIIDAGYDYQIFDTTLTINPQAVNEYFSVKWFGAKGDGSTNDISALQHSSNTCIINNIKRLYAPAGNYKINSPWIWYRFDEVYEFFTLELYGESSFWDASGAGTTISCNFKNTFGIGIQLGKGCKIHKIDFNGQFAVPSWSNSQFYNLTESTFTDGLSRDSRYSPYSAIVIDPFTLTVPSDSGYPGLTDYYKGGAGTSGSTGCEVEDCFIKNFVVGFITSPNGVTSNGEIMLLNKVQFANVKWCVAGTQAQEKANQGTNLHCWGDAYGLFTNTSYGDVASGNWFFSDINLAGRNRVIVSAQTNGWFPCTFEKIYGEEIGEIGLSEGNFFDKIFVDFAPFSYAGFNHAYISARILYGSTYTNSRFRFYGLHAGIPIVGSNLFKNVEFSGTPITAEWDNDPRSYNKFEDCVVYDYVLGTYYKIGGNSVSRLGFSDNGFKESMYGKNNVITPDFHYRIAGTAITVSGGIATIPGIATNPWAKVGTMIGISISSKMHWGIVTSHSGSDVLVSYLDPGVTSGTYGIYGIFDFLDLGHFIGNVTTGSNSFSNVLMDSKTGSSLSTWVGKVFDDPYAGAMNIIDSLSATTFTTYLPSTVTDTNVVISNHIPQKFYYSNTAAWTAEDANIVLGVGDEIYIGLNSDVETKYRVTRSGLKSNSPSATLTAF